MPQRKKARPKQKATVTANGVRGKTAQKSTKPKARTKSVGTKSKAEQATLSFRPRRPEDDSYIVQLTEEELAGVHQEAFGEAFPRDQFLRYIQSGAPTYVIERGGKRIGYYSYLVTPDATMHISALVVERNWQSEGIGSSVMQRLEDEGRRQGIHTMEVYVQDNNAQSLAFTQKLGFREAYRIPPHTICFRKVVTPAVGNQVPAASMMAPPPMG